MTDAELQKSMDSAKIYAQSNQNDTCREYVLETGPVQFQPLTDIFCSKCLPAANEYWLGKLLFMRGLIDEMNTRYRRNREQFFQKRKTALKAI
jgi:hypothetical protein